MRGSVTLSEKASTPRRPLHAGDVVVVTFKSASETLGAVDRLAHQLHSDELVGLPLSRLLG